MNTKLSLVVSVAANVVLLLGVLFLSKKFSDLPQSTGPLVQCVYVTNGPPVAVEKAPDTQAPRLP